MRTAKFGKREERWFRVTMGSVAPHFDLEPGVTAKYKVLAYPVLLDPPHALDFFISTRHRIHAGYISVGTKWIVGITQTGGRIGDGHETRDDALQFLLRRLEAVPHAIEAEKLLVGACKLAGAVDLIRSKEQHEL